MDWDKELEESESKPKSKSGSESKMIHLDSTEKQKLKSALSSLQDIAANTGCEVDELIEYGQGLESDESESALDSDSEEESEEEDSESESGKKMALYVAQLKAKRE